MTKRRNRMIWSNVLHIELENIDVISPGYIYFREGTNNDIFLSVNNTNHITKHPAEYYVVQKLVKGVKTGLVNV